MLLYDKFKNGRKKIKNTDTESNSDRKDIFVAREKEIQLFDNYLKDTKSGNGHFILVTGEAGVGKSTLIGHYLKNNSENNCKHYELYFDKSRAYEPYQPFIALLSELSHLKPEANKNNAINNPSGQDTPSSTESENLFQLQAGQSLIQQKILYGIFQALTKQTIILSLQDVHLASQTTWQFIHLLVSKMIDQKLLVFITLRQEGNELDPSRIPAYNDVLRRMTREGLVTKIVLQRFNEKNVRKYLRTCFPKSDFNPDFMSWVYSISGGLPSLLEQLVKCLKNQKIIFERNGIWFDRNNFDKEKFLNSIALQINLLNQNPHFEKIFIQNKELLAYAVLLSEPFSHELLAKLCNRPNIDIIKDMIQLRDQKVFRQPIEDRFQFKYETYKLAIQQKMKRSEIQKRHKIICDVLLNDKKYNGRESVFVLAEHLSQAQMYDEAFEYLIRAAKIAVENFAVFEGRMLFIRAISMIKKLQNKPEPEKLAEIYLKIANIDRILGLWKESVTHCHKGLRLLKSSQNNNLSEQTFITLGLLYFRERLWKKAHSQFNKVISLEELSPFNRMMSHYGLASTNFELGNYELSQEQFKQALKLAEKLNLTSMRAKLLSSLGAIENVNGNYFQAVSYYSTAIPLLEKIGDYYGLAQIYNNLGITYADTENWEKADASYSKSLAYSDVVGIVPLKSYTFLNRAYTLCRMHDIEKAKEYNDKALRIISRLNDPLGMAEYYKIEGVINRELKNWSEAERYLESALKDFEKYENELGKAETLFELALLAAANHNINQMHAKFKQVIKYYENKGLHAKVGAIEKKYKNIQDIKSLTPEYTEDALSKECVPY